MTPSLNTLVTSRVVGQDDSIHRITPYVRAHRVGLAAAGRPIGVILLMGPTGTGKTETCEAFAEVLHGNKGNLLTINCGEYQLEHEVAKLIGAPPGYLGHRETHPLLTQQKLSCVVSERSNISIVLFDEIEKAAGSLQRLLLGVLDKARLQLGDNTSVNFENTIIFMTSNLGATEMANLIRPRFGFNETAAYSQEELNGKLSAIGLAAAKKRFSLEFINRIDEICIYKPLADESISKIVDAQISALQKFFYLRLGMRSFDVELTREAKALLTELGVNTQWGARELKRVIQRRLLMPIVGMVEDEKIPPQHLLSVGRAKENFTFTLKSRNEKESIIIK